MNKAQTEAWLREHSRVSLTDIAKAYGFAWSALVTSIDEGLITINEAEALMAALEARHRGDEQNRSPNR